MSTFEERLLSALKEEITTRKAEDGMMTTTVTPVERGSRRRWFAGLSAVVAAAATVVVVTGLGGGAAYAVTKGADGVVSVWINEFSDPKGLEGELARAGVKAVVDYLPEGQTCKEPRGERGAMSGRFGASVGKEGNGISFRIEEGQVPAGETLVLVVSKSRDGDDRPPASMSLGVVKGAVAPCVPTSMPAPGEGSNFRNDGGAGFHTETKDEGPSLNSVTE